MSQFSFEKEKIIKRLNVEVENNELYLYMKSYMKNLIYESFEKIEIKSLKEDEVVQVKEFIENNFQIVFSKQETEGFLKLHSQTSLHLIKFGLDTEVQGRISDDLFNLFLFNMPSPSYGHELDDKESKDYLTHIKKVANLYGFLVR